MSKEYLEVGCEDSRRIIKEIEDLKSELDEDLQQLGYCKENEQLRAELAVKAKQMHCLTKRIEELEDKNDFLRKWSEELEAINDDLPKRNVSDSPSDTVAGPTREAGVTTRPSRARKSNSRVYGPEWQTSHTAAGEASVE